MMTLELLTQPGIYVSLLGSGGGHNAAHLKSTLTCTLVGLSPEMLAMSRRLNSECEHVQGDMRSIRLGRVFDCGLVHDAVSFMASRAALASSVSNCLRTHAPGGAAMFQPDFVLETFELGTETGSSEVAGRALCYLECRWAPDSRLDIFVTDMAYLLRDESGSVEVIHDRHVMGLFSRSVWPELIADAGSKPSRFRSIIARTATADMTCSSDCYHPAIEGSLTWNCSNWPSRFPRFSLSTPSSSSRSSPSSRYGARWSHRLPQPVNGMRSC